MPGLLASESIVEAGKRPITRSINHLLREYEWEQNSLKGVAHVMRVLDKYEIVLDPSFEEEGDLDDMRTLKAHRPDDTLQREIGELIDSKGESYDIELKSSIRIDTRKRKFSPELPIKEYLSGRLETKLAQEICAFLNREGGTIYLGVQNDNVVCGCQDDFDAFEVDGSNQDKADLIIRQLVEKNFVRPNAILCNVVVNYVEFEGLPIVILRIAKSSYLAFLKKDCGSSAQLYLRIGTSAIPVGYEGIEEYFKVSLI